MSFFLVHNINYTIYSFTQQKQILRLLNQISNNTFNDMYNVSMQNFIDSSYSIIGVHNESHFMSAFSDNSNLIIKDINYDIDVINQYDTIYVNVNNLLKREKWETFPKKFLANGKFKKIKFVNDSNLTSIGNYFLSSCSDLTSVILPNNITSIGNCFLSGYSRLKSVTFPDSVTSIGGFCLSGCSILTSVTLPNSVTSIGENFLSNCYSLTSVIFPDSITYIGERLLFECYNLTSVILPNSIKYIGDRLLCRCANLTFVILPNSFTFIGQQWVLFGCYNLKSVTLHKSFEHLKFHEKVKVIYHDS